MSIVAAGLVGLMLLAARPEPVPARVGERARAGCQADQISSIDGTTWQTHVWVEWPEELGLKRWTLLYSIREANERSKALSDCDRWLAALTKLDREARRNAKPKHK